MTTITKLSPTPLLKGEAYTWMSASKALSEKEFALHTPTSYNQMDYSDLLTQFQVDNALIVSGNEVKLIGPGENVSILKSSHTLTSDSDLMVKWLADNINEFSQVQIQGQNTKLLIRFENNLTSTSSNEAVLSFLNINISAQSKVTIILWDEQKQSSSNSLLSNSHIKLQVAESASCELVEYYNNLLTTSHRAIESKQAKDSTLHLYQFNLNSKFSRSRWNLHLQGENAQLEMHSLNLLGEDHQSHGSLEIFHDHPDTHSAQWIFQVVNGTSLASFDGTVEIGIGASKSTSEQLIRSLLLSRDARATSKPNLRIYNDDVECAHGNTVGQLEEEQLFYLQSRGLTEGTARKILIKAFLGRTLEGISDSVLSKKLQDAFIPVLEDFSK
jgi:Fe-S cluster assembly scaffold protein SufB